ncbi:MAG: UDP-N-acetylmuramate dehydrogenase [Acidimicrobiia bacterium]|nr:UDP-N-acetylmuramate dehydrogenase [Acidimicrobiia bacterium]
MVATAIEEVADRLRGTSLGSRVEQDRSLAPFTTYRVGGAAALFVTVRSHADIQELLAQVAGTGIATLVVGRGSNLLVADAGFDGLAITVDRGLDALTIDDDRVRVEAAARLPVVARATVAAGLRGFEWAVGVPGSVGGAVRMNAGGHGGDMAASVTAATVADLSTGAIERWTPSMLAFGYRSSAIAAHHLVVEAELQLAPGSAEVGEAVLAEIVRWRRENQPGGQNAGSVFTNPVGDSAGRLIDQAGGKGRRLGSAQVSTKHANFIQADADGSADDVLALMVAIRRLVRQHHGIDLEVETRLVGFGDNPW